jgi:thiosulfate dehydrogenase (quinone) large subunit
VAKKTPLDHSGVKIWALLRISLGAIFLWSFFDKLIGLGFATCRGTETGVDVMCSKAWLQGGSPTFGFLQFGTDGPFADLYQGMAGTPLVDWLFMFGLLGIGVALILGIGVRIAALSGSLMLLMMWTAVLPPENNPILDDHIIYILVLAGIYRTNKNQAWGLRNRWTKQPIVKKLPILE